MQLHVCKSLSQKSHMSGKKRNVKCEAPASVLRASNDSTMPDRCQAYSVGTLQFNKNSAIACNYSWLGLCMSALSPPISLPLSLHLPLSLIPGSLCIFKCSHTCSSVWHLSPLFLDMRKVQIHPFKASRYLVLSSSSTGIRRV